MLRIRSFICVQLGLVCGAIAAPFACAHGVDTELELSGEGGAGGRSTVGARALRAPAGAPQRRAAEEARAPARAPGATTRRWAPAATAVMRRSERAATAVSPPLVSAAAAAC